MLACLICAWAVDARAGSATDWVQQTHAKTRLVADKTAWNGKTDTLIAGIQIKLDEGWKTYWRNPGDSGLPPIFDWSASSNLKSAKLLWPSPVRFKDSAGTSIGYKKEVVFPIVFEPSDPAKPVELDIKMEFAVCADICIPAEAKLKLKTGSGGFFSRSYAPLLASYLEKVPVKSGSVPNTPSVKSSEAVLSGDKARLTVDAEFPAGTEGADLFIEGPEGFYMAPTEIVSRTQPNTVRFKVDLTKGDDPSDLKGKPLALTLVSNAARSESSWQLD